MQLILNQTENAINPEQFRTPVLDMSVHDVTCKDLVFSVINESDQSVSKRRTFTTNKDSKIKLYVNHFEQSTIYKNFIYKEGLEPEMVDMNQCVVCHTEMMPVSGLTDCRGVLYMTLGLCPCCGFFQHTRRPPKQWYADFYRKQWDPDSRNPNSWPQEAPERKEVVEKVFPYCRPGSRVLEVGSGWGGCINAFKKFGYETYGIEATEHRSQYIREKLGIPCFTGEAEDLPIGTSDYPRESFDLIFSTNVLEHVYNTRQVIEHVYQALKPDGLALFQVPIYYQENLTLNTHGISHTCNFSHANFFYLLQTIGFDLVHDYSNSLNVILLVRKAPALTLEQAKSKLNWMSKILPYRGLAYIIEKNGLGFFSDAPIRDWGYNVHWHLRSGDSSECFFKFQLDIEASTVAAIKQIKNIITNRENILNTLEYLPVQYVYNTEGVPIWYY